MILQKKWIFPPAGFSSAPLTAGNLNIWVLAYLGLKWQQLTLIWKSCYFSLKEVVNIFRIFFIESGCEVKNYCCYSKIWWKKCLFWLIYSFFKGRSRYIQEPHAIRVNFRENLENSIEIMQASANVCNCCPLLWYKNDSVLFHIYQHMQNFELQNGGKNWCNLKDVWIKQWKFT